MNRLKFLFFFLFVLQQSFGQKNFAKINRATWPYQINSKIDFDVASKMEMLAFTEVFKEFLSLNPIELSQKTGVKNVNVKSVRYWENKTKSILLDNFAHLSGESLPTFAAVKKNIDWNALAVFQLKQNLPSNLLKWHNDSKVFYEDYLSELYRLAALNPRITSEIATIDDQEVNGDAFEQKHFLLTFDDGPTPQNGNTDKMINVLNEYNLKGVFFVLGDSFNQRLNSTSSKSLETLYGKNVVASHAKIHKSHQNFADWKQSLDYTEQLIKKVFKAKDAVYFRPPYGQRSKILVDHVQNNHQSKVVLWNIDSQDWNKDMSAKIVADRQITLMLLWRKGILLFHDIHPKAQTAVPIIYKYFKKAEITWINPCLKTL